MRTTPPPTHAPYRDSLRRCVPHTCVCVCVSSQHGAQQRTLLQAHFEFLNGLCLEDLEDLAALMEADDGAQASSSAAVGTAAE